MTHSRVRSRLAGLMAVATAASTVLLGGSSSAQLVPVDAVGATPKVVTLLTGDVVTIGGPQGVRVQAAEGRAHVAFHQTTDAEGDVHVVPQDVARRVRAGELDERLFDVSELVRSGYDDATRKDLPLIVDHRGAFPRGAHARVVAELPSVGAVAVRATKGAQAWSQVRGARRIWLDGRVRASLDRSVPQIGAPAAWDSGHTGAGVTVAVLDSGIDTTHPDLADAVVGARDFTESETGADDHHGHGTHVASTITGAGKVHRGVAPDAALLNGKVLGDDGGGTESGVIAGMEWAARGGADVVNMSLGSGGASDGTDPMSTAVNRLTAETGALFVISVGNDGPVAGSVGSPGAADAALTVGAVDREDGLADFSGRGPRVGDSAIKPDITAPGVGIVAARAANGVIGEPAGDGYVALSGTSMAAPHVAGAAAILAGQHPDWTAQRLKATLAASALPNPELSAFEQGAGRVDVAAAVDTTVSSSPVSLAAGVARWPHHDDQPIVKPLSYHNSGTEPVTLDLSIDGRGPDGGAPAELITVEPATVTVPAGGTAEVTVTFDTSVDAPDGFYTGAVTATDGTRTTRTPVAVTKEVESYDLTLRFIDHDGRPTPEYSYSMANLAEPLRYDSRYDGEPGTEVVRLPKGNYVFSGMVSTYWGQLDSMSTTAIEPTVVVDRNTELVVDARDGKPLEVRVDEPSARATRVSLDISRATDYGVIQTSHYTSRNDQYRLRPSTSSAGEDFRFEFETKLAEPDGTGDVPSFTGSPYIYHLRWSDSGGLPQTPEYRFADRDLARVHSTHGASAPGTLGQREGLVTTPLPFTLTEHYTPGVPWFGDFYETGPELFKDRRVWQNEVTGRVYRKGETTTERWNIGVFGPAFPEYDGEPGGLASRVGDEARFLILSGNDQVATHWGSFPNESGSSRLLIGDRVVAEQPTTDLLVAELPAEETTYTLQFTAEHSTAVTPLSAEVSSEWTFRSSHVDDEQPIPLLAVRFAPELDVHNTAPAGERFEVPVYVQRNGSATPGPVDTPTVEVSYDNGASWADARVSADGDRWRITLDHPADAEHVSLRASVADRDGNSAEHTILHAYTLR